MKKILLYKYSIEMEKLLEVEISNDNDKLSYTELPNKMLFYGKYLFYICKNKVYFIF